MKPLTKHAKKSFILLTLILTVLGTGQIQAQGFSPKDLDGNWTRNDGMMISISGTGTFEEGGNALVMSVGQSGWPASTAHYAFKYREIKYVQGNTWKGINYRHRTETNARVKDGEAIFVMSNDKKSFKASGYTYIKN
ncbi:hypothetical protein HYN56_19885 [Flavobacterium crocinum]|uniref:DUF2147 domain-containing protein n=1 Tax=Flavobacterium crocinum TaxID=2183896 RepID=A0A2S1YQR4_9FLAO|nr:hypothetical protein [Flavobacterium crocinum]AWK06363.1 hypothetical protein HYN56_19885 [Flavobacterium crocinum]